MIVTVGGHDEVVTLTRQWTKRWQEMSTNATLQIVT